MAKGAASKEAIFNKLMEIYNDAFMVDSKTLRIPMVEDGEVIEIKVALTAAKDILGGGNATNVSAPAEGFPDPGKKMSTPAFTEPTEEEKETLKNLLDSLA